MSRLVAVPNPATRGALRAVALITDRAKRYRARNVYEAMPAALRRYCVYCGAAAELPDHVDGDEAHNEPENIAPACRSCNAAKAHAMLSAGVGRRTAQFNPEARGARNLGQWVMAVSSIRRRDKRTGRLLPADQWKARMMPVREAVAMIRATPAATRAEYARQLAAKRRPARGRATDDEVPW